jgi:hypothetical protein
MMRLNKEQERMQTERAKPTRNVGNHEKKTYFIIYGFGAEI